MHRCILLLITCAVAVPVSSQSRSNSRNFTFQISSSPAWTDTGLNLQPGDTVTIAVVPVISTPSDSAVKRCDPAGLSNGSANTAGLPVPEASAGALIAKLQADASPTLVGARTDLHIDTTSHLFLGMNLSGTPDCQGGYEVKVQTPSPASETANPSSTQQTTRGAQLKSQLATAAQVFMSGQFGVDKPTPNSENATSATGADASPAPVLHVSEMQLDADLRKQLDSFPR